MKQDICYKFDYPTSGPLTVFYTGLRSEQYFHTKMIEKIQFVKMGIHHSKYNCVYGIQKSKKTLLFPSINIRNQCGHFD